MKTYLTRFIVIGILLITLIERFSKEILIPSEVFNRWHLKSGWQSKIIAGAVARVRIAKAIKVDYLQRKGGMLKLNWILCTQKTSKAINFRTPKKSSQKDQTPMMLLHVPCTAWYLREGSRSRKPASGKGYQNPFHFGEEWKPPAATVGSLSRIQHESAFEDCPTPSYTEPWPILSVSMQINCTMSLFDFSDIK